MLGTLRWSMDAPSPGFSWPLPDMASIQAPSPGDTAVTWTGVSCCSTLIHYSIPQMILILQTSGVTCHHCVSKLVSPFACHEAEARKKVQVASFFFCILVCLFTFPEGSNFPFRSFLGSEDLAPSSYYPPRFYFSLYGFWILQRLICFCLPPVSRW